MLTVFCFLFEESDFDVGNDVQNDEAEAVTDWQVERRNDNKDGSEVDTHGPSWVESMKKMVLNMMVLLVYGLVISMELQGDAKSLLLEETLRIQLQDLHVVCQHKILEESHQAIWTICM